MSERDEIRELLAAIDVIGQREWTEREKMLDRKWAPVSISHTLLAGLDDAEAKLAAARAALEAADRLANAILGVHDKHHWDGPAANCDETFCRRAAEYRKARQA